MTARQPRPDAPPVGAPVPGWDPRPLPPATPMTGRHCRLEPLEPRHAAALHAAYAEEADARDWTYMAYGPFADAAGYAAWVATMAAGPDPQLFAICDGSGRPAGVAGYLRVEPRHGSIEIGHIRLSARLQRTTAATEALVLMLARVFDELGYRRCEWKCDALNAPSRRAALRLGFVFEGIFRQHMVVKGHNRDTAWYAMTDDDWRRRAPGYAAWLAETGTGPQRRRLAEALDTAMAETPRDRG